MCRKTYAQQPMPGVIPLWCGLVVDTCKLEELFEVDQTIEAGDRSFTGSGHKSPATSRKRHLLAFDTYSNASNRTKSVEVASGAD